MNRSMLPVFCMGCMLAVTLTADRATAQVDTLSVIGGSGLPGSRDHVVRIALMNAEPVAGIQLMLTAAPKALGIDSVKTTLRTAGFTVNWNERTGKMLLVDFTGRRRIEPGTGAILNVFCRVKKTATPGTVALSAREVVLADPSAKKIPTAATGGIFVVKAPGAAPK